jgi:hypothetical protein
MYEMLSAIHAESSTREVRQRATPSQHRERLQERELRLQRATAAPDVAPTPTRGPVARLAACFTGRVGGRPTRPGQSTA